MSVYARVINLYLRRSKNSNIIMKKYLLLLIVVCVSFNLAAQQIDGTVKDDQGKPLANASIALKKTKDSSVVKLNITNAEGKYHFTHIGAGSYFVAITHVGYTTKTSGSIEVSGEGNVTIPEVTVPKQTGRLKEVTVTGNKPMVEVKADKTVLNVEGSVNAVGQDALELLRKSPGVVVDKDDNISLSGKNGVQVYIDGKPSPLSGADLAAFLRSLQSSSIESIEIITNPSAKYEAAGNAGIINIRLKKNKAVGTNGSVNAGFTQGIHSRYNTGFSLNHRNKYVNIYSNYNYNNNHNESFMHIKRSLGDTLFDLDAKFYSENRSHNFKTGLDYFLNKRATIGAMVTGNFSKNYNENNSNTPIYYQPTGTLVRTLSSPNRTNSTRDNANFNLNYRFADTSGHELNMDADAAVYRIRSDQFQPNYYYYSDNTYDYSRNYSFNTPSDINIYSFKTDYEQNFRKGKLGLGGKSSYVSTLNDLNRYDVNNNVKYYDSSKSNSFNYKENINALYATYNRALKHINFQLGVRMENTNIEGISNGFVLDNATSKYGLYHSEFKRSYVDLFPSGGVTFTKNPMKQWALRYSRRIDRPAYQDLNPFEMKLDEYSYMKGNINLRPQYTNSFSVTHTYHYTLNITLNYSHVDDVFTQLVDTTEKSKSFMTKKNLATQNVVSLNVSYPFTYKWYTVFANMNSSYSHYQANFGVGRTVNVEAFNLNLFQQHTFRLGKGYTGELSSYYTSPGIWSGTFKTQSMWSVDAGLMKNILKDKGSIKVAVGDIFQTMRWRAHSEFASQTLNGGGGWESRVLKLNFTYRFGSNTIKAARQRQTSQEEEKKRVDSQGGLGGQ
jgi:iron complex outermembrane recepter protein